jgi:hypothetical protein
MPSSNLLVDDNPAWLSVLSKDLCWCVPSLNVDAELSSLKRGSVSITKIERVISRVTEALGEQSEGLRSLEDDARSQAKKMLETLGE